MPNPLRSLAARITLLVFGATVVSSLTVAWISMQSLDGFLRQKVDQRFPQVAHRIAQELDQWYTLRSREVEVFASSAILVESAPNLERTDARGRRARDEAGQYLRYVLDSFPQFESLVLADPEGRPIIEVGKFPPLSEALIAELAPNVEHTRISDARKVDGRLVQIAAVPLRDAQIRTIARLYATIDFRGLDSILETQELGESASVLLANRDPTLPDHASRRGSRRDLPGRRGEARARVDRRLLRRRARRTRDRNERAAGPFRMDARHRAALRRSLRADRRLPQSSRRAERHHRARGRSAGLSDRRLDRRTAPGAVGRREAALPGRTRGRDRRSARLDGRGPTAHVDLQRDESRPRPERTRARGKPRTDRAGERRAPLEERRALET